MDDPQNLPPEVADALAKGNLIEAIKLLRQRTNLGLAEAKDLIVALQKQGNVKVGMTTHSRKVPGPAHREGIQHRPGLSPGEVPRRSGGAIAVAIVLAALVAIGAAAYFNLP